MSAPDHYNYGWGRERNTKLMIGSTSANAERTHIYTIEIPNLAIGSKIMFAGDFEVTNDVKKRWGVSYAPMLARQVVVHPGWNDVNGMNLTPNACPTNVTPQMHHFTAAVLGGHTFTKAPPGKYISIIAIAASGNKLRKARTTWRSSRTLACGTSFIGLDIKG